MAGPPNQKEQARYDFGPPGVLAVFMVWGWLAVGIVLVGQEIKTAHLGGFIIHQSAHLADPPQFHLELNIHS